MMKIFWILMLCVCSVAVFADAVNKFPLNPAETILDLNRKKFSGKALTPNTVFKNSYFVEFSATDKLKEKARAQISKKFKDFSCENYDTLILFLNQNFRPQTVTMAVTTDAGTFKNTAVSEPRGTSKSSFLYMELPVEIKNSKQIKEIKIIFEADKPGRGTWKNYWGFLALRDSKRFADYLKYWDAIRKVHWQKYITTPKAFEDAASLTFAKGELEKYREYVKDQLPAYKRSIAGYITQAKKYCKSICESDVALSGRRIHMRKNFTYSPASNLALYSVLCKNTEGLKWAARCALAQATFESWRRQFWQERWRFHGPHVFKVSYISSSLSAATSLSASALTGRGREYILYALLDKGYKNSLHSLWSRNYAFKMNQAAVFLMAKVMPLLLFEKYWPRVKPYTEIAMNELKENLDYMFKPDGGYLESMGYMDYTIACAIPSYMAYSAARNLPLSKVIPEGVKKSANFGEIVYSTSKNPKRNVVSFGQTNYLSFSDPKRTLFMAAACPGTIWERFVDLKSLKGKTFDPILWRLSRQIKISGKYPALKPFVEVASIGCVNSYRKTISGGISKTLFMGFAPMGKREEDIGKFIFEYNGDVFADAMTGRMAPFYATAEFQNLLVPTGGGKALHPVKYTTLARNKIKFIPVASGNKKSFKACIDNLGASWDNKYFKKWSRSIDSPNPENITITDNYKLGGSASGVDFTWVTALPAKVTGKKIVITGDYGSVCELSWNPPCKASVERFTPSTPVYKGMFVDKKRKFSRIKIHREGKSGKIIVKAKFIPQPGK